MTGNSTGKNEVVRRRRLKRQCSTNLFVGHCVNPTVKSWAGMSQSEIGRHCISQRHRVVESGDVWGNPGGVGRLSLQVRVGNS